MAHPMSWKRTRSIQTLATEKFLDAYVRAALWSSVDDDGDALDENYDVRDIAPETLHQMKADVLDFSRKFFDIIAVHPRSGYASMRDMAQAGHDFWLTRNGHGAGFQDGDWGVAGDSLAEAAHAYGTFDLYVGDDGFIYGQ